MSSYLIRGLKAEDIPAFRKRCKAARIQPDHLLRALIQHAQPEYLPDLDETRVAHRLAFTQSAPAPTH